ncbi:HTH-type transcriptional activator RhaS [mine drainage metagenome]|uniref:HTH-type transcriptional activator RhaS n=1 Tax=mine drainage metagenome TaxID=410659 RepID=A0A1J5QDE3_9ZZZZ
MPHAGAVHAAPELPGAMASMSIAGIQLAREPGMSAQAFSSRTSGPSPQTCASRAGAVTRWSEHVATDADEHAQNLSLWNQRYDQISSGGFSGRIDELWLDHAQVFMETANQRLRQSCSPWSGALWFGIPAPLQAPARLDGHLLTSDDIALRMGGEEFELHTPVGFDLYGVVIDTSALMTYLECVEHVDPLRLLARRGVLRADPRARQRLCTAIERWLGTPTAPGIAAELPAPCDLQATLFGLVAALLQPQDETHGLDRTAMPHSHRQQLVRRVCAFVLEQPDTPISVSDLCAEFHLCRRSLQYCFLDITGLPPLAYLRALRLNAVRRELRWGRVRLVSESAYAWGFDHLSQFSRDYARQFGQLPSQALRSAH